MRRYLLILTLVLTYSLAVANPQKDKGKHTAIFGDVISGDDKTKIEFATIYIKENTNYAAVSDDNGRFKLKVPFGENTLVVSYVGYKTYEKRLTVRERDEVSINVVLEQADHNLDEVVIRGESRSAIINKTAYNVQSLSLDGLKNRSASVADALSRIGGVKIRESGGVGSDSKISINGFTGNHVKIFIDGVLLDQNNSAFSLSNMPANFAERIDVYSGVVPIEFGSDVIGGVINVITNKDLRYRSMNFDVSTSYGSFNTFSNYVNFGQTFENGLTYSVNLYQNYSDNNYWIDNTVVTFTENPGWAPSADYSDKTVYRVQRFNDAYHNETAIATIGVANKSWADVLTLKINYSNYNNEVQTGVVQDIVYGEKERFGHSITPTLNYMISNMFTKGLDLHLTANYSSGYTRNYDPATSTYSWSGASVPNSSLTLTDNEIRNSSYNTNLVSSYKLLNSHYFTLSTNFSSSSRISRSIESGTTQYSVWDTPLLDFKSISGASYRYKFRDKFDATAFAKYYWQANEGVILDSSDNYVYSTKNNDSWGYGAAASYFITEYLQAKLSYEKAYRLPTTTEIFGDGDLEVGTFDLNPETSDNYNLNITYNHKIGNHHLYLDGALIYRDTRDYIIRSVSSSNSFISSATYENHGKVETKGYIVTLRYGYDKYFSVGGSYSDISPRNAEKSLHGSTSYETLTYGLRIPNTPYVYATADASVNLFKLFRKDDSLSIMYDLFYQYEFPLYWETIGYADTKSVVPTQLAHNITVNYSFMNGRYSFAIEMKNITDANLYDNYSLQKAGRAFYGKFRVHFSKIRELANR